MIEELQVQVHADREKLRVEAETRDVARTNLRAAFVESSVMGLRPTSNPERPFVGYLRIKWRFEYTDGKPLGDAVFDYVYARTPDGRWIKADEVQESSGEVPRSEDTGEPRPPQSAVSPHPA